MIWSTSVPGSESSAEDNGEGASGTWPIHEIARNADEFPDSAGKILRAGSELNFFSTHLVETCIELRCSPSYGKFS